MFVSRSSFEKPSPFERWVRTASPSRYSTSKPEPSSSGPTICAIVVLPAPESPVNQSVKPLRMCLLWQRGVVVDPALELVRAGPTAGPLLLVRRGRTRARPAADRAVAGVVERVVRDLVGRDERLQPLLVSPRADGASRRRSAPTTGASGCRRGSGTDLGGCPRSTPSTARAPQAAVRPCGCGSSGRGRAPTGSGPRADAARRL